MKQILGLLAIGVSVLAGPITSPSPLVASLTLVSSSTTVFLDSNGTVPVFEVAPNSVWTTSVAGGATWVSSSPCSGSRWPEPGCELANLSSHSFYSAFDGQGPVTVEFAADDTANVYLDGVRVYSSRSHGVNLSGKPLLRSCRRRLYGSYNFSHSRRGKRPASASFRRLAGWWVSYGLAFDVSYQSPTHPPGIPKPAAWISVATGLIALGTMVGLRAARLSPECFVLITPADAVPIRPHHHRAPCLHHAA